MASSSVALAQLEFGEQIKLTDPVSKVAFSRAVDMDGDGDIDIFAATDFSLQSNWWENDGSGNFIRHFWKPTKVLDQTIFGLVDWDGDGRQDLWLHEAANVPGAGDDIKYLVAPGLAGGSFGEPILVIIASNDPNTYDESLLVDVDGDGREDIIGDGRVFLRRADGGFGDPVPLPTGNERPFWEHPSGLATLDYDGDGDTDLLTTDPFSGMLRYFENSGGGAFLTPSILLTAPERGGFTGLTFLKSHVPGMPPMLLTLTFDQEYRSKLTSYERKTDGTLTQVSELPLPGLEGVEYLGWLSPQRDPHSLQTFICSNAGTSSTRLFEIESTPAGLLKKLRSQHDNFTLLGFTSIRDLDGDGIGDLVVPVPSLPGAPGSATDHIVWFTGDSEGNFSGTENLVAEPTFTRILHSVSDLDGDGDNDLLLGNDLPLGVTTGRGSFSAWLNDGDGLDFDKRKILSFGNTAEVLAIEDFVSYPVGNGYSNLRAPFELLAGRKDIVFVSRYSDYTRDISYTLVNIAYQDPSGNFFSVSVMPVNGNSEVYYRDWDGDGTEDLIFRDSGGEVSWSKRREDRFDAPMVIMTLPSGMTPFDFDLIDIDMDGDLDLFAKGGLFGPGSSYWAERDAAGLILALRRLPDGIGSLLYDDDGDGFGDFIDGQFRILLLRVGLTFEVTDRFLSDQGNFFDFDEDGDLDQIISAPTNGTTSFQRLFWSENRGDHSNPEFGSQRLVDGMEISLRNQYSIGDMDGDGTKDLIVVSSDTALVEWFKISNRNGPQPFGEWMATQGLRGNSAGPGSDWDADGRSNWEEFIFGTQAKVPDRGDTAFPRIESSGAELDFTYTRRKSGSGLSLSYPMQRSTKLDGDWVPWNPGTFPPIDLGDYEEIHIPVTPGEVAEFFRVVLPAIPD